MPRGTLDFLEEPSRDETPEACLYLDGEHYPVVVSTGVFTSISRTGNDRVTS